MKNQNSFLKKLCGELAEKALAAKYEVNPVELFDENGCFYRQYQDLFNRLYDLAEEQMKHLFHAGVEPLEKTSGIYTTGAFLAPVNVIDCDGDAVWMWAVTQFEDDSYLDGKICDPIEKAETPEKLLSTDENM
jgi:hypothetical protein